MDIIHLLPDSVANQIAAGEVIQRPASVIKELVENSVDAGASEISIVFTDAGRTTIQVIDNGKGMSPTDARMAFERHATSKISNATDLFALHTMGFRGEALASIAAVAQVELHTRIKGEELGTVIEIAASKVVRQEFEQCAEGTRFIIKNIFFNLPARRKFLKSNDTERRNIIQEVQRIVLAHPDITFRLFDGNDIIYDLPSGNFKQRVVAVFGKKTRDISRQLVSVSADTILVKLTGYVGTPQSAGSKTPQFFFVNNRYMNHPYFRKAVIQAYDRMISPDDVPPFFLNLEVDPSTIDVNIHPTKTEIKFENEREIWSIITIAIKEALGKFNITPSIDFETGGNIDIPVAMPTKKGEEPQMPGITFDPEYNPFAESPSYNKPYVSHNWQQLYDKKTITKTIKSDSTPISPSLWQTPSENGIEPQENSLYSDLSESIIHKNRYLCISMNQDLLLIDMVRALQRIYYDDLIAMISNNSGSTQKLLFPDLLELTPDDFCLFSEIELDLKAIGFEIHEFGKYTLQIEGTPALFVDNIDPVEVINTLLAKVKDGGMDIKDSLHSIIADTFAKSIASAKIRPPMSPKERNILIGKLFASSNPNHTPDGKKIIEQISEEELVKSFG